MKQLIIVFWMGFALLSGCVSLQNAPVPNLNERISDPGKSRIYVIRPKQGFMGMFGSQALQEIYDNNGSIGLLPSGKYLVWEADPTMVVITPRRPKYISTFPDSGPPIKFEAKPGELYFFALIIHDNRFVLSKLSENAARKLLTETKPAGN